MSARARRRDRFRSRRSALHLKNRALLLLALAVLAVGAAAVFARFALASGGPLAVSAARLTLAALPLLALAAFRGRLRAIDPATELRLVVAGVILAVHFATWIASLKYASVAISTLLVCTTPVWTEAYSVARRRRVDAAAAASVLGALAGVAIVVGAPDRSNTPFGIALALGGAVAFAAYLLAVRGTDARYDTLAVTARTYTVAALLLALAALALRDPLPPFGDARAWGGIWAMALLSQLFGHTALNSAVRVLSATFVSTMTLFEPVIAAVLAAWLFGERLGAATAAGAAVILGAIAIAVRAENGGRGPKPAAMRYDLAVIGSGQGGVPLAVDFAKRGKRVVLFERGLVGGTCVNVGCTPSKAFLASAHAAGRARRAADVHVHCDVRPDVAAVMRRVRSIVAEWRDGVEKKLAASGVELIRAEASFEAPGVLRAGGSTYEADVVVLDTGTRAKVPALPGLAGTPYLTNENFFLQETLPRRLVVLGSGYVGLELGQGAARLGSDVVVVTPDDRLIGREESDVCSVLTASFERDGIRTMLSRKATHLRHDGTTFTVTLDDGTTLEGDGLLLAVGREPNVPDGTADRAGIALDPHGFIACDDHLRTTTAGHYALGDAAGQPQFTHVAWEDFRRLRAVIGGDLGRTRDDRVLGYAMYTEPQVGRAGLTADDAERTGRRHRVVTLQLAEVARGVEWGLEDGFFRLVVDPGDDAILGATFVGYEAGELIHVIIAHMQAGATWRVLERSVHIHPTFSEGLPSLARLLL